MGLGDSIAGFVVRAECKTARRSGHGERYQNRELRFQGLGLDGSNILDGVDPDVGSSTLGMGRNYALGTMRSNKALQLTANPLRSLSAAELGRYTPVDGG